MAVWPTDYLQREDAYLVVSNVGPWAGGSWRGRHLRADNLARPFAGLGEK
jgi:hypothetical protein